MPDIYKDIPKCYSKDKVPVAVFTDVYEKPKAGVREEYVVKVFIPSNFKCNKHHNKSIFNEIWIYFFVIAIMIFVWIFCITIATLFDLVD